MTPEQALQFILQWLRTMRLTWEEHIRLLEAYKIVEEAIKEKPKKTGDPNA